MKLVASVILAASVGTAGLADFHGPLDIAALDLSMMGVVPGQAEPASPAGAASLTFEPRSASDTIFQDGFLYRPAPVSLSGQNWDHAGGTVAAWIGARAAPLSVQINFLGTYTLDLPGDIGADELIRLTARSEGPNDWRELISVPASAPRLVSLANADGRVTSRELPDLDFSVIETARWLAAVQANDGQNITGFAEYQSLLATITDSQVHAIAAVLAVLLEDSRFELPALPPALTGFCATVVECLANVQGFQAIGQHIDATAPGLRLELEQLMQLDWCDTLDQRLWYLVPRPKENLRFGLQRLISFDDESRASGLTGEGAFSADCDGGRLLLELTEPMVQESFPSVMIEGVFMQVRQLRTLTEIEMRFVERRLEGDRIEQRRQWLLEYPDNPELGTGTELVRNLHTVPRSDRLSSFEEADLIGKTFALAALVDNEFSPTSQSPSPGRIEFLAEGTAMIVDTGATLQWSVDENALSLWSADQLLELSVFNLWRESDDTPYVLVERLERSASDADWRLRAGAGFMPTDLAVGPVTSEGFYQDFGSRNSAHPRETIAHELQGGIGWRLFTNPDPDSPDDFLALSSSVVFGWEPTASGMVLRSCWFEGPVYEEPESCQFAYLRLEFHLLKVTGNRWYMIQNTRQWGSGGGADLSQPPVSDVSSIVFFERQNSSPPWFVSSLPESEREALEDYYQTMDGENWVFRSGWMGPIGTECRWTGVGCNRNLEHVIRIGFFPPFGESHHGSLPPSLVQLTELEQLQLRLSGPSEPFPSWLGQLQNLRGLRLLSHPWTGELPATLANLAQLTDLQLSSGALEGEIPEVFAQLQQLRRLNLNGNQLSGPIPDALTSLPNLQSVLLASNQFSGPIPESIGALQSLTALDLSGNELSGQLPDSLGSLGQLQSLNLFNNQLSGSLPSSIGGLGSLINLNLFGNQLSGPIPASIGNLLQLQNANLANNMLTGPLPNTLVNLDQLASLDLSNNNFSGSFPVQLAVLDSLQSLRLAGNQLSGFLPNWIGDLTRLQVLQLQNNAMGGQLPPQLMNLVNLNDAGGLNLCGNSFATSNTDLDAFLASKHLDSDWRGCQQ